MRTLDSTDFEILRLLTENARRPWSEIADQVGLSSPSVSDRVARLQDLGIVRRFTLDLDRSKLRGGVPVLVDLTVHHDAVEQIRETLAAADGVEHVFTAAEPRVLFQARLPEGNARSFLEEVVDTNTIADYEVVLLTSTEWTPQVEGTDLALTCAQCGNPVRENGETLQLSGERYYFCCPSCSKTFEDRYDRLRTGIGD